MSDALHARLERYRQLLSAAELARLEAALTRPQPPALRINTLKISVEEARDRWAFLVKSLNMSVEDQLKSPSQGTKTGSAG